MGEVNFARTGWDLNPRRLEIQHDMNPLWRHRKRRVDGRREGVDQFGPRRIFRPQRRAAMLAEMPAR